MPTKFADLEALVSEHIDDLYGEPIKVVPRADGEFIAAPSGDPGRAEYTVTGILDLQPKVVRMRSIGRDDADSSEIATDMVHVSFDVRDLGERASWPRRGDLLMATDRAFDNAFRVVNPEFDGIGRLICRCTRMTA
jgi:hypothetical protein